MDPLLTTKLQIPPVRPDLVPRRRLVARLEAGLAPAGPGEGFARKLTLVSAPAGFGKTTLLAAWAAAPAGQDPRLAGRIAWLSLDDADNDPVRFLAYLIAAVQTVEPGLGQDLLPALQSPALAQAARSRPGLPQPVEALLTALINQVQALAGAPPLVLILDDCHLVAERAVHDILAFLLEHLPGTLHLILSSRADPPLPLSRLRGRGQLAELRQADLRFLPGEAAELLNRVMGLDLSPDQVQALTARTEGWATGLQMASLALQSIAARPRPAPQEVDAFLDAFSGSDRYVLDYLVEEVLQHQPAEIQGFLLHTALLDRFCAPLCDALFDADTEPLPTARRPSSGSQRILQQLEAANLFIIPLDAERRWYRYHRLFADLLRRRLRQQVGAEGLRPLQRRASAWYEAHDLLPEAIEHALGAGDHDRAAALVERVAEATLMRSEVATFLGWVERLPGECERQRPALCLLHAWALLLSGRPLDAVEARLQEAGQDPGFLAVRLAPLRAFVAACQGQVPRAAELSRQALAGLPEQDLFLRGIATYNLGISHLLAGELAEASHALEEAARVGQQAGNVMVAVMALCALAELSAALSQLPRAAERYRQALDVAAGEGGQPLPVSGMALIGLGELAREWNDLEAAGRYLAQGIERVKDWGDLGAVDGYLALARVRQAQGDAAGARAAIDRVRQLTARSGVAPLGDLILNAYQVRLWIANGELDAAQRWLEEHGAAGVAAGDFSLPAGPQLPFDYHVQKYERLVWARLLLARGRPGEALGLVEPFLHAVEQRGGQRAARAAELQMLRALALQGLGEPDRALEALAQALSIAEPGGYVRLFLDEGEPLVRLLRLAAARGIAPAYVRRLLAAWDGEPGNGMPASAAPEEAAARPPTPSVSRPPSPLVEPLTEREGEVLGLLATHLNSTEIAEQLCISTHTARYHIKNIYGKLGVHRRTEAVERARELGLL